MFFDASFQGHRDRACWALGGSISRPVRWLRVNGGVQLEVRKPLTRRLHGPADGRQTLTILPETLAKTLTIEPKHLPKTLASVRARATRRGHKILQIRCKTRPGVRLHSLLDERNSSPGLA